MISNNNKHIKFEGRGFESNLKFVASKKSKKNPDAPLFNSELLSITIVG